MGGDLNGIPEIGRVRSPGGSITRNRGSAQRGRAVRDGLVKAVLAPRTGGNVPMPSGLAHGPHMQRGLGGPMVLWREARPTAAAVAAWLVAITGGRGKNPRIPGV